MLGIGGSEVVIIALLVLIIFGPSKLPQMARDLGRFVGEARRSIDEFKDELTAASDEDEEEEVRRRSARNAALRQHFSTLGPSQALACQHFSFSLPLGSCRRSRFAAVALASVGLDRSALGRSTWRQGPSSRF